MCSQTLNTPKWQNDLRLYRVNKGYSQNDVAVLVGLSQNTIHQIEKGSLSGRKHMDSIGKAIKVNPKLIFPYYEYLTYSEAASTLDVSSTLISKRVEDGAIPYKVIGGTKMVKKDELMNSEVKKRPNESVRALLIKFLSSKNGSGATVEDMLKIFSPFSSEEEKKTKKSSIQSVLSRTETFRVDKNKKPPTWHL